MLNPESPFYIRPRIDGELVFSSRSHPGDAKCTLSLYRRVPARSSAMLSDNVATRPALQRGQEPA